jgi:hypothetical protein
MCVLTGFDLFSHEPGTSHSEMRKHVRSIIENEIQHLSFPFDIYDGESNFGKFCVENVLLETCSRRERFYLEGKIVGELEPDCFDFG